ncbi:MAG: hypothetical protein WC299_05775 [Kiritimatiellia bacterium]
MKLPRIISPQTLVSTIRTMIYGTFAAAFTLNDVDAEKLLDAALVGGIFADYMTWIGHTIIYLPQYIAHRFIEGIVNVAFAVFFFRYVPIDFGSDPDAFGMAFLAFMLVTGIKITFYALEYISSITDDRYEA